MDSDIRGALVITGPTASGKSSLTMELARKLDAEIISADSAQVYRGLDIGSAKPGSKEREEIPHHLIDIRNPEEPYSAADFREDAIALAREISGRGRLPIISGGTMLYLKALKEGMAELPAADQEIRDEILGEAERYGWGALHEELKKIDPESSKRIGPTDTQRLQRAIEVFRLTGVPISELHQRPTNPCPFPLMELALVPERSGLHKVIEARFMQMLESGFIDEVAALRERPGVDPSLPAIKAVGYRQIWAFLEGEVDRQTMIDTALAATRQLAKRQYTWLRGWKDMATLESANPDKALKMVTNSTILV